MKITSLCIFNIYFIIIIENKIWYVKWSAFSEGELSASRVVGDAWASCRRLGVESKLPSHFSKPFNYYHHNLHRDLKPENILAGNHIIERACLEVNKLYFLSIITCKKNLFY